MDRIARKQPTPASSTLTRATAPKPLPCPQPSPQSPSAPVDRVELTTAPSTTPLNLDRALAGSGQWGNLFTAFSQGGVNNCAATGVIKATMDTYGNHVFETKKGPDGTYQIAMKDGFQVNISPEELSKAEKAMGQNGEPSPAKAYASLCYAVMAKRRQTEGQPGCQTFEDSLTNLGNSQSIVSTATALGLASRMEYHDVGAAIPEKGAVAAGWKSDGSDPHIVYLDQGPAGCQRDQWGTPQPCDGTNGNGGKLACIVTFRKEENWTEMGQRWWRQLF